MPDRPNILLIIAHDLGAHLGCYGVPNVPSPRLDGLAEDGVRFARHYCTAAFCSPSRGAILTGELPHANGLMALVNLGWDLPSHNVTLGQALRSTGYETFLLGLQHEVRDNARLETMFDHVSDRSVGHGCDLVTPMVEAFLHERDANAGRPFYARVGFAEVHRAYDAYPPEPEAGIVLPPYLEDTPGAREDFAQFHGAIRCLDTSVGRILDELNAAGLRDDTLVIFTVDHGIAFPRAKATLYDTGTQTALLMRWPNGFNGGRVCDPMLSNIDLYPTVMDAIGETASDDLMGRSFWPLLAGGEYEPNERVFAEKSTSADDVKRCIRTSRYKYIRNFDEGPVLRLPTDIEISLTRRDMGDHHLASRVADELYDLETDPFEQHNLAGDLAWRETEATLSGQLNQFLEETADPIARGEIDRPPE
jgi:N-sulfoglucosamine sulfohydrolase